MTRTIPRKVTRSSGLGYLAMAVSSLAWITGADAGYMSVSMTQAVQCGTSTVQWSGDSGPYHLLLTPTTFVQHGYNVWIESIPNGTTSYDLLIRQPAGVQYMVTVWGASGISYAATTDVLTVAASTTNDNTCFLSDSDILALYSFSWNMTTLNEDYPPQCSNVSMNWPTSLESNVTSSARRRDTEDIVVPELNEYYDASDVQINVLDASSSDHRGNTTNPPTMFGIIPLGNSFSIPITFSTRSRFAKYLPASSLSDTPTTYTSQGQTYLNWTVDLAKGTRFILVAGIGSAEKWASGGSSAMLTVGQGSTGCIGSEQNGGGAPSVTASSTSTSTAGAGPGPAGGSRTGGVIRIAVACVCSVVGTLVIVGLLFLWRRSRRRRQEAVARGEEYPGGFAGLLKGTKNAPRGGKTIDVDDTASETPLDLIASRNGGGNQRHLAPLALDSYRQQSPAPSPTEGLDPFRDRDSASKQPFLGENGTTRSTTLDGSGSMPSPISPIRDREDLRGTLMHRHSSQDALLNNASAHHLPRTDSPIDYSPGYSAAAGTMTGTSTVTGTYTNLGMGTYHSSSSRGPLMLHNPGEANVTHFEEDERREGGDGEEGDLPDLKRETIAYLGGPSTSAQTPIVRRDGAGGGGPGSIMSAPPGRRRRGAGPQRPTTADREMEYMVHRDAGRVVPAADNEAGTRINVLELPPRYEELTFTEEESREREERERQTR